MLAPFFAVAMRAPGRQLSFRRLGVLHIALTATLVFAALRNPGAEFLGIIAQLFLVLGLVEGAAVIGWRLTQLPKSQALEFYLTSPIQPARLFLAEALVGVGRFTLVSIAGWPILLGLAFVETVDWTDLAVVALMPLVWGVVVGLGLTAWIYEPDRVKRIGEILGLVGVLVYLVIGVLAGEHLKLWLAQLPDRLGRFLFDAVLFLHNGNPFGVLRYWFDGNRVPDVALERMANLHLVAGGLVAALALRGAMRLRGHFHDRHYRPLASDRTTELERIGERPLSWWAVKRVMEYSGRVNLWLAVGFAFAYSAYIVAGDSWPAWMGKLVFALFDGWGGPAMVATALAVLAAVPAVYQFGLWDATATARCRRLELLLLTELDGRDYAHASFAAAWKRGRGYLVGVAALAVALAAAGRIAWWDALAALAGTGVLWLLAFAIGFRGFASGNQTNGIASLVTLGLPLALVGLWRVGQVEIASLVPTAAVFVPLKTGATLAWAAGFGLALALGVHLLRTGIRDCDRDLRRWFDANQGRRTMD
jgi:hypothetical protein